MYLPPFLPLALLLQSLVAAAAASPQQVLQVENQAQAQAQSPADTMQLRSHTSDNFCRNDDMHIQLRMDFSSLTPTSPATPASPALPSSTSSSATTPVATSTTMPSSSIPTEVENGQYNFWSVMAYGPDTLSIAVDASTDVLWCRMTYNGNTIITRAEQILSRARETKRGAVRWIQIPFVWRARSVQYGSVLVDDVALKGEISFAKDEERKEGDLRSSSSSSRRRIQIVLDGADMGREGWVEGQRKEDLAKDAGELVEEIERQWGELEGDEDRADLDLVRRFNGCIMDPSFLRANFA